MRGNLCQATPSKTDVWCHPIVSQKNFLFAKNRDRKIAPAPSSTWATARAGTGRARARSRKSG